MQDAVGTPPGLDTDSVGPPATGAPSIHSSVPSQGMRGWSHDNHASLDPSGEKRGAEKKS